MVEQNVSVELVASWGGNPLDSVVVTDESSVRIGPSARAWLTLPAEVLADDVTLLERGEGGWTLRAPEGSELVVRGAEARDGVVALGLGVSAEVKLAGFSFFVRGGERRRAADALPADGAARGAARAGAADAPARERR